MENGKLIFSSDDKRKRKRETKKIRKMRKIEEKIQKQEEFSHQLQSEIHSIFKHLTTIQETLVVEERSRSARASSAMPCPSPIKKHSFPTRFQQDNVYAVTSNENSSDDDEEGKSRTWETPKNLISIFHSQIQPQIPTYSLWRHVDGATGVESSLQSTVTHNTHTSHYSTALQSRFSIDSGTSGGGGGGGGGGGEAGPHRHIMPTPGGGGGGGGGHPPVQKDSPCDCTLARQMCKCKGETAGLKPPSGALLQPSPAAASFRASPATSRETAKPLTDSEKAMCTCKGSGKIRRECPLKAKRRLNAAAHATNVYSPAGPQQFTDKELANAFDEKSETDVHLDPNEQVFMDVFPELNTDLSHHHQWPMPHTPMQDYSNMPNSMFADPFSFSTSELAKAFDEEEIEDVSLSENECVFMDQFPSLTEPTRNPRGGGGQGMLAPGSIRPVASSTSACSARQGMVPQPVSNQHPPAPSSASDRNMSPPTQECTDSPLPDCTCSPCATGGPTMNRVATPNGYSQVPSLHISQPSEHITTPSGPQITPPMPSEPAVRLEEVSSVCSCNPCPSYEGDGANSPLPKDSSMGAPSQRPASQHPSQISKVISTKMSANASTQTCPDESGQPYGQCICEPTCEDYRMVRGITGSRPQAGGQGSTQQVARSFGSKQQIGGGPGSRQQLGGDLGSTQQVGGKTLAPPGSLKASSTLQIDQPDLSSGEPQAWSDKDLEHAFSEEKIPHVELSPNEALFMDQFPQAAAIPDFIRMPQPLPFTPMQDFSSTPQDQFAYPEEFSDKELATAFEEEDVPDVQLSEHESNFMNEFPGISGGKNEARAESSRGTSARQVPSRGGKICRCSKRVLNPCKCKQRKMQRN